MFRERISAWHDLPAREARTAPFPPWVDPQLVEVLQSKGVRALYTHQREAVDAVHRGEHVVIVTPTASGKTLAYNLPVLNTILEDPNARALYLFPTKALAQDQLANLHAISTELGRDIKTYTYDGDTPPTARKLIRTAGHIVVSNPDMLHTGVLPHHTKWVRLFENLKYVVLDELHNYRGVFGSHVANVMRRLVRICEFYGSRPQFILSSATIANPQELAERITGVSPITLVDDNGAPQGPKTFVFYNPPVVNKELGLRRSALLEARDIASQLLANDIQTIVFARTRQTAEVLLTYLQEAAGRYSRIENPKSKIRGYRGGYLPNQRREIERGLRDGTVRTVVSTNALELGIDIGALEAAVLVGYPGTVASTWQQAGRAGRRSTHSLAVMVASSSPLDQFLANNPQYFFERSPENGLINPDNLFILTSHLQCAAFELPFQEGEGYGTHTAAETAQMLEYLEESYVVRNAGGMWHWSSENFPAESISLRTAATENFVIIDNTSSTPRVIGEMDRFSVLTMLHEEAIYLHEGQQYHVDKLDWDEQKAYVRAVEADYYTDANLAVTLKVLDITTGESRDAMRNHGEVMVSAQATIYKKIKLVTHENIGWGKIHLPEQELHTTAYWLCVPPIVAASLGGTADDRPPTTEGSNGHEQLDPSSVIGHRSSVIGRPSSAMQSALVGLANVLSQLAPLYLMCDPRDLGVVPQVKNPLRGRVQYSCTILTLGALASARSCMICTRRSSKRQPTWCERAGAKRAAHRAWGRRWKSALGQAAHPGPHKRVVSRGETNDNSLSEEQRYDGTTDKG
jgi:DEAD/DEAH box helicase domain-containing protein